MDVSEDDIREAAEAANVVTIERFLEGLDTPGEWYSTV